MQSSLEDDNPCRFIFKQFCAVHHCIR